MPLANSGVTIGGGAFMCSVLQKIRAGGGLHGFWLYFWVGVILLLRRGWTVGRVLGGRLW